MCKEGELVKLKMKYENRLGKVAFMDSWNGVKGFWGTGIVWFVGQKPSPAKFPSYKDERFYEILKKHHLENAHITDMVKNVGTGRDRIGKELQDNLPLFMEEFKLIPPKIMIACGGEVYDKLLEFKEKNKISITIEKIHLWTDSHRPTVEVMKKIDNQLSEIVHK